MSSSDSDALERRMSNSAVDGMSVDIIAKKEEEKILFFYTGDIALVVGG